MDNGKHRSLWKNIVIGLQLIFSVLLVISVFLVVELNQKQMMDADNLMHQNFEDSKYYQNVFQEKLGDLIKFLNGRRKFETDGVYDPDRVVNIIQYAKDGSTMSNEAFMQLESLIWEGDNYADNANYGYIVDIDAEGNEVSLSPEIGIFFQYYRLGDLVTWSKEGYIQYAGKVEEKYASLFGANIQYGVDDRSLTQAQADALYQALVRTLDRIGEEETAYYKGLNEFDVTDTNLTYFYMDDYALYTNMTVAAGDIQLLDYAKQQGSYIYCNDDEMRFRTNIAGMDDYYYNNMDGSLTGVGRHAVFMVAVDTEFSQEDDLSAACREFERLRPWGVTCIVLIILSFIGWLMTLVYLTIHAGRRDRDGEMALNWLDRVKTEIFFVFFMVLAVVIILFSVYAVEFQWEVPGILIMAGTMAFIYDGVFLIFYLSMIRRMKAGVLWEYSLTNWVMVNTRRVVGTWKASVRIIMILSVNIIAFLMLCYGIFIRRNVICVLLLLALLIYDAILFLRDTVQRQEIMRGIRRITQGELSYKIPLENLGGDNCRLAEAVNSVGDGLQAMVEKNTKNERMKADLITNVSHDIKTPLTSIINYVNLMKMEQTDNQRMQGYINVLEDKAQRLRQLTEDLVEASRISSGNITLQLTRINLVELVYQTAGEFNEKFEAKDLTTITKLPSEAVVIMADGRRIWRVLENLYNNVAKYAMAHTRVYVTLETSGRQTSFSIKNISDLPLEGGVAELTERFARGDESRSTEGSGLGLSIAQNLTTIMGGTFEVSLDGDLFGVTIRFPLA
ncbi:MAG: HAMP domain-containing histidine kinase [Lachnospiraceae bacterium]|nr:HAMP domain-containing histidine kinase [Lachnospiraceae bacterium]